MWECTATLPPVDYILTESPLGCASPPRSTSTSAPPACARRIPHQSGLTDTYCIGLPPSPKASNRHWEVKTQDTGLSVHAGASHELSPNRYILGCMSRLRDVTLGRPARGGRTQSSCMPTTRWPVSTVMIKREMNPVGDALLRFRLLTLPIQSHPQSSPPCAQTSSSR